MSADLNFIDIARAYATAHKAYVSTSKGRAEQLANAAFKRAYLGCINSDVEKQDAISALAAVVLGKLQNSYIFKHERKLLEVQDEGVTLDQFRDTAIAYGEALAKVKETPEFMQLSRTKNAFRKAVLAEFGGHGTVESLQKRLDRQGITNQRVLSRLSAWKTKFGY